MLTVDYYYIVSTAGAETVAKEIVNASLQQTDFISMTDIN